MKLYLLTADDIIAVHKKGYDAIGLDWVSLSNKEYGDVDEYEYNAVMEDAQYVDDIVSAKINAAEAEVKVSAKEFKKLKKQVKHLDTAFECLSNVVALNNKGGFKSCE